jgi:hypothetical protein
MAAKIGRNDPCWCGSGKKYKKCHLDRGQQDPITIQETLIASNQARRKYCLHPSASNTSCQGNIIRAHSIQRSGGLTQIAVDGHVYMLDNHITSILKGNGWPSYKLVGIKEATTFTGFCQYHDSETFEPIENSPFAPSQQSVFLLAYRALCRELYAKKFQYELISTIEIGDKGLPPEAQRAYQENIKTYKQGVRAGLDDLNHYKSLYDRLLLAGDFSDVSYYAILFDGVPDFMCSSAILLEMDFKGNQLQTLQDFSKTNKRLEQCTFSLIATDSGGAAVFSWIGANPPGIRFVDSLDSFDDADLPHAVTRFSFEFFENVAVSPKWWNNLTAKDKATLQSRTEAGLDLTSERDPRCLMDDGLRVVNWKVVGRTKTIAF